MALVACATGRSTNSSGAEAAQTPRDIPPPDVAAPPADATVLPSGVAFKVLQPPTGDVSPTLADTITIHYTGWTADGRMFDSSVQRGRPGTYPLSRLIKGWQEVLPLMKIGERRRMWIPAELAYGNGGRSRAPQGMLVFDVELLAVRPGSRR